MIRWHEDPEAVERAWSRLGVPWMLRARVRAQPWRWAALIAAAAILAACAGWSLAAAARPPACPRTGLAACSTPQAGHGGR